MRQILNDKWQESLWGKDSQNRNTLPSPQDLWSNRVKLFFLWGEDDHWVDSAIRDKLISSRARQGSLEDTRPLMEIDRTGIRHSFCTSTEDSKKIAIKVAEWLKELI